MPRIKYYVVFHEKQWKINLDGKHYGPYKTQAEAIKAAVDAAHSQGRKAMMPKYWYKDRMINFVPNGLMEMILILRAVNACGKNI
jgi:hypothetical protein